MQPTSIATTKAVMRRAAHERLVAELREGRRQRAVRVASAKTYRRHPKHRHAEQD